MKTSAIIIPAYNPDENLIRYVRELIEAGFQKIIVVDDGSRGESQPYLKQASAFPECELLVHEVNRGKGRALKDALKLYLDRGYDKQFDGVITVDADGQHLTSDVIKLSEEMKTFPDQLILGERAFDHDVPFRSRFGNTCTRYVFRLLYGMKVSDTQTGLRGIPNQLIPFFWDLEGERYEYEMNMLMECSLKKIGIRSVTIQTVYLDDNSSSHFNAVKDSFKIYKLIFKNFFHFALSSLSSSIIDIALFQLMIMLLKSMTGQYILYSTVIARICSATYNFLINKTVVFKSGKGIKGQAVRYAVLCVVQMLLSAFLVTALHCILPIGESFIKIVVDTVLFFISYRIQRSLVFRSEH